MFVSTMDSFYPLKNNIIKSHRNAKNHFVMSKENATANQRP